MNLPDDEEGGNTKRRDADVDSEEDVLLSEPETVDGTHVLRDGHGSAAVAAVDPFLDMRPSPHHGGTPTPTITDLGTHSPGMDRRGKRPDAVGWRDLPQKKQLVVITLARLSEPLVQTSLQVCPLIPPRI